MIKGLFHPKQLHLVLIGGGHAQIQLLKSLGMKPIDGLAVTLITDVLNTPYSGMLPGFISGQWKEDEIHIDLAKLASFAGADLIHAPVKAIEAEHKRVHISHRPPVSYDILSINCGAAPELEAIEGADEYAIAVKPIAHFIQKIPEKLSQNQPINIIGAGVAGLELAFAFHMKYESQQPEINIFSRSNTLLPKMPKKAGHILSSHCKNKGITVHFNKAVTCLTEQHITTSDGQTYPSGLNFVVTGVTPPPFIASLGHACDKDGFVRVKPSLNSDIHPEIFATGDVANVIGAKREKAGVFAVRAGAILTKNIRRYVHNEPLIDWKPQSRYLALINTGHQKAMAIRNGLVLSGHWAWRLKNHIDLSFMRRFSDLPVMRMEPPTPLPRYQAEGYDTNDAIFAEMRCSGCAAKASATLLEKAMSTARATALSLGASPDYLPQENGLLADATPTIAPDKPLIHSFDSLKQMLPDPFTFAQIAANHALSDLYVAGATPLWAQAHLNLQEASTTHQQNDATQLLTGALMALSSAQTRLIGGHTSQSSETSLGFAVTGAQSFYFAAYDGKEDYVLICTKGLGTGVALAAYQRQLLPSHAYDDTMQTMLLSNQQAAEACFHAGTIAMTDITGFGIARHAQNLIDRLGYNIGIRVLLGALPLISHIEPLLETGLKSSSFTNNQMAVELHATPTASRQPRFGLLFDPQTSGGVLAIVPKCNAEELLTSLNQLSPFMRASIIGQITSDNTGLMIES